MSFWCWRKIPDKSSGCATGLCKTLRWTLCRSAIFCADENQKRIAQAYIDQLNKANVFEAPIVTTVGIDTQFYMAEDYHQDYVVHHPDQPYIVMHDLPKVANLRTQFPGLYRPR